MDIAKKMKQTNMGWFTQFHKDIEKIGPFEEGEKYSTVKDMKDAYQRSLSRSMVDEIYDQIPEHAFFDIKTPLRKPRIGRLNQYNPVKPKTNVTFFEHRNSSAYFLDREKKTNTKDALSDHINY